MKYFCMITPYNTNNNQESDVINTLHGLQMKLDKRCDGIQDQLAQNTLELKKLDFLQKAIQTMSVKNKEAMVDLEHKFSAQQKNTHASPIKTWKDLAEKKELQREDQLQPSFDSGNRQREMYFAVSKGPSPTAKRQQQTSPSTARR